MAAWTPGSRAATPSRLNHSGSFSRCLGSSSRPLRPLRGNLGRCLPPDPRQTHISEVTGPGDGRLPAPSASLRGSRVPSMRYICLSYRGCPAVSARSFVISYRILTAAVWRGSGGRHLPRFPRRGRRGREEESPGSPGGGGGGEKRRAQVSLEGAEGARRGTEAAREASPPEWAIVTHPLTVDHSGTTGFTLTVTVPSYRLCPAGGIA